MTADGTEDPRPAVSVIVCTRNRPAMLRQALQSVLAQDCREFEIIVVDDGSEPPASVQTEGPGHEIAMRTLQIPHGGPGAARAAGLEAARGEYIAWCDDDDLWSRDHLGTLLSYLRAHADVDLVYGDAEWIQAGSPSRVVYSIDYDASRLGEFNYILASDVLHTARAARAAGGFDPSLRAFEDWDLWLRISRRRVMRHLPRTLGQRRAHDGCVSNSGEGWQEYARVYEAHQSRLREAGPPARHDLKTVEGPARRFDPATWRPGRRELVYHAVLRQDQGYGSVARQLLLALERQDIDVTIAPTVNQPLAGLERFYRAGDDCGRVGFYYNYLNQPSVLPSDRVISYAMAESTAVPCETVEQVNRFVTLLYVPCRQNVTVFHDSGVRVPVKVLHHGIDPGQLPLLPRGPRDVFTFGTFGELSPRKGIDVLIRAFRDEFSPAEPVRLLMKSMSPPHAYRTDHPRIEILSGYMGSERLLGLLQEMDAFVMPSRGEGFGLCGLEAMATGLPVIATNWSGPADYLDPADSYPLNYRLVDAAGTEAHHMRFHGQWAEPDYEHLRSVMRWAFEHPQEAARKGRAAAARVHRDWTWDHAARQVRDDLDALSKEYGR
jgi:glycosyltransferase involved in cell wall biosynthesis